MDTKNVSVVIPSHLSHTGAVIRRTVSVPECLAEIVRRLNDPVHGDGAFTSGAAAAEGTPPVVALADGRLLVVARDLSSYAIASLALGGRDPGRAPRFEIHRDRDPTGISGTGVVAHGWVVGDAWVVRWHGDHSTTTVHHGGYKSVEHLHKGLTRLVWLDRERIKFEGRGFDIVFRRRASAFGRPGWLVSLRSEDGDPDEYNMAICDGGPGSAKPRHGDNVVGFGDFELDHHCAATVRRHAHKPMRVSRRTVGCGGDPSVITLANAEAQ